MSASAPAAATARPSSPTARKLAVLFWCLLTRGEDYAHQQPSLTAKKLRLLELTAGAPTRKGKPTGDLGHPPADAPGRARARPAGRGLLQADGPDWQAARPQKPSQGGGSGRERDTGARIDQGPRRASRAADHKPLTSALRYVITRAHPQPNADHSPPPAANRRRRSRRGDQDLGGDLEHGVLGPYVNCSTAPACWRHHRRSSDASMRGSSHRRSGGCAGRRQLR